MKKQIIGIVGILLMISLAQALYEGTNIINSGLDEIITWQITNNNTYINATQISNTSIQVTIPELARNISFSILFKGYKNEAEKVVYVNSGGSTHYIYKNNTIYQNRTQYKDKEIIKERNNTIYINNTGNVIPSDGLSFNEIFLGIIALILFMLIGYLIRKSREEKDG